MAQQTDTTITKTDLAKIEASLKKVIEVAKTQKSGAEIDDMLRHLTHTMNEIKTLVEFDHERRLRAIEDYLQNL